MKYRLFMTRLVIFMLVFWGFLSAGLIGCASTGGNFDKFTEISSASDFRNNYFRSDPKAKKAKGFIVTMNSENRSSLSGIWTNGNYTWISIDNIGCSVAELVKTPQYERLWDRIENSEVCKFYILRYDSRSHGPKIVKIDGLIAVNEIAIVEAKKQAAKDAEAYRRVRSTSSRHYSNHTLLDWDKAFPTREEAEAWLDDIVEKAENVDDVVSGRKAVYDQKAKELKIYQLREVRDALLTAKNNLIEAYNRYVPINNEIANILAKGAVFRDNYLPGLEEAKVKKEIESLNNEYAKLIDIYPVN
jgi:hypothetical protein